MTIATKFTHGAWLVVVAIPVIMVGLLYVNRHYEHIRTQVRRWLVKPRSDADNHVLMLVPDASPAVADALGWIRSIRPRTTRAIYVPRGEPDPEIRKRWAELSRGSGPDLEELVKEALQDGPPALALVTERVLARLGEDEHYRSAGRIAALVAKLATPHSDRERPWVAVSEVVEIEDWSLEGGAR